MNENVNRDLFITETIINHLQRLYPQEYSDAVIIKRYKKYVELMSLKKAAEDNEDVKFSTENQRKLAKLNTYFYGNSDGNRTSPGDGIASRYLRTIETIKSMINSNDNAIKDVVTNIYQLVDIGDSTSKESFSKYINEIIIPGLQSENTSSKDITNFSITNKIIKDNIDEEVYQDKVTAAKEEKKKKEDRQKEDIERYKKEQKDKDDKIKEENKENAKKSEEKKAKKEQEKKEKDKKDEAKKTKDYSLIIEDKFQEIQNLIVNSDYKDYYNNIISDYISVTLDKVKDKEKIDILTNLQSYIKLVKTGGAQKTEEELKAELKTILDAEIIEKKDSLTKLERTRDTYESELKTLNKKIKDLELTDSANELIKIRGKKEKSEEKLKEEVEKQKNKEKEITELEDFKGEFNKLIDHLNKLRTSLTDLKIKYNTLLKNRNIKKIDKDEEKDKDKVGEGEGEIIEFFSITYINELLALCNINSIDITNLLSKIKSQNNDKYILLPKAEYSSEIFNTNNIDIARNIDNIISTIEKINNSYTNYSSIRNIIDINVNIDKYNKSKRLLSDDIKDIKKEITEYELKITNLTKTSSELSSISQDKSELDKKFKEINQKITELTEYIDKNKKKEKESKENELDIQLENINSVKFSDTKYKIPQEYKTLFIDELNLYIKVYKKKEDFFKPNIKDEEIVTIYEEFIKLYDKFIILHKDIILKLDTLNKDVKTSVDKNFKNIDSNLKAITDIFKVSVFNKNTIDAVIFDLEKRLLKYLDEDISIDITDTIKDKINDRRRQLKAEIKKIKDTLESSSIAKDDKEIIKENIRKLLKRINYTDEDINEIIKDDNLITEDYYKSLKENIKLDTYKKPEEYYLNKWRKISNKLVADNIDNNSISFIEKIKSLNDKLSESEKIAQLDKLKKKLTDVKNNNLFFNKAKKSLDVVKSMDAEKKVLLEKLSTIKDTKKKEAILKKFYEYVEKLAPDKPTLSSEELSKSPELKNHYDELIKKINEIEKINYDKIRSIKHIKYIINVIKHFKAIEDKDIIKEVYKILINICIYLGIEIDGDDHNIANIKKLLVKIKKNGVDVDDDVKVDTIQTKFNIFLNTYKNYLIETEVKATEAATAVEKATEAAAAVEKATEAATAVEKATEAAAAVEKATEAAEAKAPAAAVAKAAEAAEEQKVNKKIKNSIKELIKIANAELETFKYLQQQITKNDFNITETNQLLVILESDLEVIKQTLDSDDPKDTSYLELIQLATQCKNLERRSIEITSIIKDIVENGVKNIEYKEKITTLSDNYKSITTNKEILDILFKFEVFISDYEKYNNYNKEKFDKLKDDLIKLLPKKVSGGVINSLFTITRQVAGYIATSVNKASVATSTAVINTVQQIPFALYTSILDFMNDVYEDKTKTDEIKDTKEKEKSEMNIINNKLKIILDTINTIDTYNTNKDEFKKIITESIDFYRKDLNKLTLNESKNIQITNEKDEKINKIRLLETKLNYADILEKIVSQIKHTKVITNNEEEDKEPNVKKETKGGTINDRLIITEAIKNKIIINLSNDYSFGKKVEIISNNLTKSDKFLILYDIYFDIITFMETKEEGIIKDIDIKFNSDLIDTYISIKEDYKNISNRIKKYDSLKIKESKNKEQISKLIEELIKKCDGFKKTYKLPITDNDFDKSLSVINSGKQQQQLKTSETTIRKNLLMLGININPYLNNNNYEILDILYDLSYNEINFIDYIIKLNINNETNIKLDDNVINKETDKKTYNIAYILKKLYEFHTYLITLTPNKNLISIYKTIIPYILTIINKLSQELGKYKKITGGVTGLNQEAADLEKAANILLAKIKETLPSTPAPSTPRSTPAAEAGTGPAADAKAAEAGARPAAGAGAGSGAGSGAAGAEAGARPAAGAEAGAEAGARPAAGAEAEAGAAGAEAEAEAEAAASPKSSQPPEPAPPSPSPSPPGPPTGAEAAARPAEAGARPAAEAGARPAAGAEAEAGAAGHVNLLNIEVCCCARRMAGNTQGPVVCAWPPHRSLTSSSLFSPIRPCQTARLRSLNPSFPLRPIGVCKTTWCSVD